MSEQSTMETPSQIDPTLPAEYSEPVSLSAWALLIAVGGAVIALDQYAKWLVASKLVLGQSWEPIPAIAGFLRVTYSRNIGAAFGLMPQFGDTYLLLSLTTVVALVVSYPRLSSAARLIRVAIAMIAGGALSNAVDRILLGYVVDYAHIQLGPGFSNISNFADHAITLGVTLLILDQWLAERRETQIQDDGTPEGTDAV